jgi:hypothetical protein
MVALNSKAFKYRRFQTTEDHVFLPDFSVTFYSAMFLFSPTCVRNTFHVCAGRRGGLDFAATRANEDKERSTRQVRIRQQNKRSKKAKWAEEGGGALKKGSLVILLTSSATAVLMGEGSGAAWSGCFLNNQTSKRSTTRLQSAGKCSGRIREVA